MQMGDSYCFGCSSQNPIGLKLKFWEEGELEVTEFVPQKVHQSFDGVCHGGLIGTVMDELFGNHCIRLGVYPAVTARLTLRFRKAALIGEKIRFYSRLERKKSRLYEFTGWAEDSKGNKIAEGTAEMMGEKNNEA